MTSEPELKLVCLLDVLGFESILRRIGLTELHIRYEKLVEYVRAQTGGMCVVPTEDGHVAVGWLVVGNAYFSDSLLFWTRYDKISQYVFAQTIADAICFGLEIELPLRGAIAVGEAILDTAAGVFLGFPLVEVARVERLQNWIGASFGFSFAEQPYCDGFRLDTVMPFKSHYKDIMNQHATGMTIDWPRKWRESRKSDPKPIVMALDIDPAFSSYYSKSLEFIEFSERNHEWYRRQDSLDYG